MTSLAGEYGDLFWNLQIALQYLAGSEIHCILYVANVTDTDREYMLMATASLAGAPLAEYPITVDGLSWFTVEAQSTVRLPGSIRIGYTDCILTLSLYEKESNAITDSVSVALTSYGPLLPEPPPLPTLPDLPYTGPVPTAPIDDWMGIIMMVMVLMMVGTMMKGVTKERPKP